MVRLVDVFTENERTNWLKSWLAIGIAKAGLEHFVDNEIRTIHNRIYNAVMSTLPSATSPCTNCYTANLLKCPTPGMCNKRKGQSACTSMHDSPLKQYRTCPLKICDKVRDEITKEHRFKHGSWKNTSANKWSSDPWEIAKYFLPPDGYKGTSSVKDTDFNGVVSIMLNCTHFESKFSFQISPPQTSPPCLLSKVRDIGRKVRHSSQCKVTDNYLQDIFTTLETLLKDLAHDVQVQDAMTKLQKLQNDTLVTTSDMITLLDEANETLKKVKEVNSNFINEMREFKEKCTQEIAQHSERLKHDLDEHAEKCKVAIDEYVQNITDLKSRETNCQAESFIITLEDVFTEKEMNNWLKSLLAIGIAKSGLEHFVDTEAQTIHSRIYNTVHSTVPLSTGPCTECFTDNLLKCSKPEVFEQSGPFACPSNLYEVCPLNICDKVRDEITNEHRFKHGSWKNTSANKWSSDPWEIAKCFLPPDGYKGTSSVKDTDFNGVVSILLNCKHFESKFSFPISPIKPCPPCLLTKARDIARTVCHSRRCKVTDNAFEDIFTTLENLLNDLQHDVDAQAAVTKLQRLRKNEMNLTTEMITLLGDAHAALKEIDTEKSLDEINVFLKHCIQQLGSRSSNIEKEELYYQQSCQGLMDLLKIHYNQTLGHIPISALIESEDEKLSDIYITPNLQLMSKAPLNETNQEITKYNDIFVNSDTSYAHIFIQGEAGSGKTTFCAKLVLDWCEPTTKKSNNTESCSKNVEHDFDDVNSLKQFQFVFYVSLRRSLKQNEITKMIREQLIDLIYASDGDREQAHALLDKILKTEKCFIVLDGLDEWIDHEGKYALPIMSISHRECTILITTRHWKLAEGKVKTSLIGKLVELKGVKNPDNVFKNILGRIFIGKQLEEKYLQFKAYARNNRLNKIFTYPLMLGIIVCSWADGLLREGSQCEIYSLILDCLLKKITDQDKRAKFQPPSCKCFTETQYLKPNIEVIDALSEAAFHLLFAEQKEYSLVFTDQQLFKYHVSNEQRSIGLKSGILSEIKQPSRSRLSSLFSFIHKSVQEFLAAYYISRNINVIDTVINEYWTHYDTACGEITQVFVFVCGMNTLAANKMSMLMAEHGATSDIPWQFDTDGRITFNTTLQDIVLDGFKEAQVHEHSDINLQLSHFVFNNGLYVSESIRDIQLLHDIFTNTNSSIVQELVLDIVNYGYADAEYSVIIGPLNSLSDVDQENEHLCSMKTERKIAGRRQMRLQFNLLSCHMLKRLYLNRTVTVLPGALLELKQLKELCILCTYEQLDLSAMQQLELLHTSHDVTLMPKPLRVHRKLKRILVTNIEQQSKHNIVRTSILLNDADLAQFGSFFPIPTLTESIEITDIHCSPILLRSLLNTFLRLNHHVNLKIKSKNQKPMTFISERGYTIEMDGYFSDWSKVIHGLRIKRLYLQLRGDEDVIWDTMSSLAQLETLRIGMGSLPRNIKLPSSLNNLILDYNKLSSSELCCLLKELYSLKRPMNCWLKFGYVHMLSYYPVTKYRDDLQQHGLMKRVIQYRIHDVSTPATRDDPRFYDDGPTFEMKSWMTQHYISMLLEF